LSEIIIQPQSLGQESRPLEKPPLFRAGEILQGKITGRIGPNQFLAQFKNQEILVESSAPLPTKRELSFQVVEIQPKVLLKLLSAGNREEQTFLYLLKKYLSSDVPLGELGKNLSGLLKTGRETIIPRLQEPLAKFLTLLNCFSFSGPFLEGKNPLPELLLKSGLFLENRIKHLIEGGKENMFSQIIQGDLKGLAMKIRAELQSESRPGSHQAENPGEIEEWAQGLDRFINKMELYQILNLRPASLQKNFSLFLPLWFGSEMQFAEFNFSFSQVDPNFPESEELSLLFLLQLPELGKMRIEVKVKEKELFCLFMTADHAAAELIRHSLPGLTLRLNQLGFHSHLDVSLKSWESLNPTLVNEIEQTPESLLNIKV